MADWGNLNDDDFLNGGAPPAAHGLDAMNEDEMEALEALMDINFAGPEDEFGNLIPELNPMEPAHPAFADAAGAAGGGAVGGGGAGGAGGAAAAGAEQQAAAGVEGGLRSAN